MHPRHANRSLARSLKGTALAVLLGGWGVNSAAADAPLVEHAGPTNPATEGFAAVGSVTLGTAAGNAWQIADTSTTLRLRYDYNIPSSAQEVALAGRGWSYTWSLSLIDAPTEPNDRTIEVGTSFRNVSTLAGDEQRYVIKYGVDSLDPTKAIMRLLGPSGDTDFILAGKGEGTGFHKYQLINPGGVNGAALYVDGSLVTTYSGFTDNAGITVRFGSLQEPFVGTSQWEFVQFAIPEPVTGSLLAVGAATICMRRRGRTL